MTISFILFFSWYYGIFNTYNYFSARSDINDGNIQIIATGELSNPIELNVISESYGFEYVEYSCIVDGPEFRGINMYNAVMEEHLIEKFGSDWQIEYNRKVDSLVLVKDSIE